MKIIYVTSQGEKLLNGSWKKKNGLMQRERPPGRESPQQEDKVWQPLRTQENTFIQQGHIKLI